MVRSAGVCGAGAKCGCVVKCVVRSAGVCGAGVSRLKAPSWG